MEFLSQRYTQKNAGISPKGIPLDELTLEGFKEIVDTNLIGAFIAAREAMKVFKSQSPQGGKKRLRFLTFYGLLLILVLDFR